MARFHARPREAPAPTQMETVSLFTFILHSVPMMGGGTVDSPGGGGEVETDPVGRHGDVGPGFHVQLPRRKMRVGLSLHMRCHIFLFQI